MIHCFCYNPSIPISKALELVEKLLRNCETMGKVTELGVDSIMELLRWMFSLTYCEYNGKHCVLDSGPIGLGTTDEIAKIYMEDFQIRAMNTSPCPLDQWYWYVDDSELKCKKEDSEKILEHLNGMEEGVIQFTKEEQKDNILPVLDLKQRVDRKTKQVECMLHYKKTHTNMNAKEKSNHPPYMKKGIIKGFADRARALCDDHHLCNELKNIEDVFVANGYEREKVRKYMETERNERKELVEENENYRGVVSIPYVQGLSEQFKRVAMKRNFRTAFRPGRKVRDIKTKSQQPVGDKRKAVVYKITCKCDKAVYVEETWRLFGTRRKEHESKVRLTGEDIRNGRLDAARERTGKEDGGLARHSVDCGSGIDWDEASVVACEYGLRQRKAREGIQSPRERSNGNVVLNNYEPLTTWRPVNLKTLA